MRTLRPGLKGEDIRYFQYIGVTEYGQKDITMDGSFGPATTTMAKNIQRILGFTGDDVDGLIGPATKRRMGWSGFIVDIYQKEDIFFAGTPYNNKRTSNYPTYTLKQWAQKENALITYNLAFFNMTGSGIDQYGPIKGRTLTYLKAQGVDCGYGGTSQKITIDKDNICAGYQLAYANGRRYTTTGGVSRRSRNANGLLTNGDYFHIQSLYPVTEKEIIDYMVNNHKVDIMLIQDSGGSTGKYDWKYDCLIAPEKGSLRDGRPVASVVCVKKTTKPYIPIIDTVVCPCCGQEIKE